jgi:hypothetical protein
MSWGNSLFKMAAAGSPGDGARRLIAPPLAGHPLPERARR